ncbi:MAG: hypothetical protein AVDCRST_MAG19-88 [uncultured Thermomicrobiales bacterium]|uniref:Uncharacterized protein n=1 Tax=uncultured Thermomicrobiales bacterium TaxID=1645740 RepID=A0A6J4U876_9BACT|nr:MAG: hypothetical protein AVDCRST_MAG19-88 [uncultured Thermomicrobiales bacterium]
MPAGNASGRMPAEARDRRTGCIYCTRRENDRTTIITPDVDDELPAVPRGAEAPVERAAPEPMVPEPDRSGTVSSG